MIKKLSLIAILSASVFAIDSTFGTLGYGRIQTSLQNEKENICFKAPNAGSKYRLGNECETWLELGFFQESKFDNGVIIHNQIRPTYSGANEKDIEFVRMDELYSEISNIFDNSVSFWVGRRFYERYDSHMSDYFFLNMSGDGVGFKNLDLGSFLLSYSFIFDNIDPSTVHGDDDLLFHSHDVRLSKKTPRGEAILFLNYMKIEEKRFNLTQNIEAQDGYSFGVLYKDEKIFDELFEMKGESMSGLFFGDGVAKGAGSNSPFSYTSTIDNMLLNNKKMNNAKTWRLINYNTFENSTFGVMSNLVYELKDESDFSNTKQDWFSVGVRPYLFLHKYVRVLAESGYDHIDSKIDDRSYSLFKNTAAVEFALEKGVMKRPVLRFYYTHASWSDDAKGLVGSSYYADRTSGDNVGVQLEYWW
jgi:maltoporin